MLIYYDMHIRYISIMLVLFSLSFGQQNKLFWDGLDWNQIPKSSNYDTEIIFRMKTAYLHGILDGRLYSYLKVWAEDQVIADNVFSETVDYLSNRELIKNLDYFYKDPMNSYIPVANAIIISNMYAERIPIKNIENYINSSRKWINNLTLDLDTLNYSKLLEQKAIKHNSRNTNQYE
ncbi:hypothetical protein OAT66_00140 [Candidatus Marinimicrobia bacterium]|jgi:hypothetical protein|nr:hypothetical protein [Candidatus Neomarinimicrobiota bacterium]